MEKNSVETIFISYSLISVIHFDGQLGTATQIIMTRSICVLKFKYIYIYKLDSDTEFQHIFKYEN